MRQKQTFTLVELLVVIGIIAILAGLVIPAVIRAQMQGRITQAKSDMANILLALKGVESTYNKMVAPKSGSTNTNTYSFDGKDVSVDTGDFPDCIILGGGNDTDVDAYDCFIAELSVPNKVSTPNINKRKIKFLDPSPKFDPTIENYKADTNKAKENRKHLWRDPWGNRYVIIINTQLKDEIPNPATNDTTSKKSLAAKAIVYSYGPNGEDNKAKNILYDVGSPTSTCDDIASWH